MLKFIEYNEVNKELDGRDKNLSKIQDKVTKIKSDEEVGVRYMQNWEEQYYLKQQGIEEGIEQGQLYERSNIIATLLSKGKKPKEVSELLGYSIEEVLAVQSNISNN